jgi:hypothetical protein
MGRFQKDYGIDPGMVAGKRCQRTYQDIILKKILKGPSLSEYVYVF